MNPSSKNHLSKRSKSLITVAVVLTFLVVSFFGLSRDARTFKNFSKNFFVSELSSNTLNMHYTLADPASYGIKEYIPTLASYSKERKDESIRELSDSLKLLRGLNPSRLNRQAAATYSLLLPYLENEQKGLEMNYYGNPLSPSSGMQSQLPILLAEYTFRSKRDIEDYLNLLDQTDTYFEGISSFLKEQSSSGLFMPDYSVDKVVQQCGTIIDRHSLDSGSHFLVSSFAERLESLYRIGTITAEEKDVYLKKNTEILTTVMLPAYQKLAKSLLSLKGSGSNINGLYYYPQGKEYYLYLLRAATGSYRDIKDIKMLLYHDFENSLNALITLVKANPTLVTSDSEIAFPFKEPGDMLRSLQHEMAEDFPPLTEVTTGAMPSCTVKNISANLEDYCSPAFYLTPPLDDIAKNVIYINQKNQPNGVGLFTTLAHEGYPGHLYQTVYSQLFFQKNSIDPVRSLLSYGGYVEGWAMYVELQSYDYAKSLIKERSKEGEILYESYKIDRKIQLCLYSLLDIAIHYEGASYKQVHSMLSGIGISNPSTTKAIYEYIVEEPATYPKYYLGYLEIQELKKEAALLWGDSYSDRNFHQFYLENGPGDFTNLKDILRSTVSEQ